MKRWLSFSALLLTFGVSARADSYTAEIENNSSYGQSLDGGQFAGIFRLTEGTPTVTTFCVDMVDHVGFGTTNFSGPPETGTIPNQVSYNVNGYSGNIWSNQASDVGNRLAYVLTQIWRPISSTATALQKADLQGTLWNLIGGNFTDSNAGSTLAAWTAMAKNNDGYAAHGYVGTTNFLSDVIFVRPDNNPSYNGSGDPFQYQVLIGVAPEPSSMAIAGLGSIGLVAFCWRRRKV
jgi:hypothetical protein